MSSFCKTFYIEAYVGGVPNPRVAKLAQLLGCLVSTFYPLDPETASCEVGALRHLFRRYITQNLYRYAEAVIPLADFPGFDVYVATSNTAELLLKTEDYIYRSFLPFQIKNHTTDRTNCIASSQTIRGTGATSRAGNKEFFPIDHPLRWRPYLVESAHLFWLAQGAMLW